MDYMNELSSIANTHGGMIETKVAIAHGISKAMLSISKRSEKIIFSHETALFLHGISDRTPFEHVGQVPEAVCLCGGY